MTDYGHDLSFGIFVTPRADSAGHILRLARLADAAGLDSVSVQDHPYQPAFLDAWTLLTAIAAATERVAVFPNVANLPLRPPAVLARSVASLDILSGGRAELGIGTGAFWDAIAAMGGPRRTAGESVDALREAIGVIRALWTPDRGARVAGEYYSLSGAKPGPFPVHDVGIWVGAYKERMLRLTGAAGDGWLPSSPYAPPEQLAAMNAVIDAAAAEAGRSPADVRRIYNISGSFSGAGSAFLQGPPKVWAEQLAGLALDEGMSGFVLSTDDAETLERFAAEVAPADRPIQATSATRTAPADNSKKRGSAELGVAPTPHPGMRLTSETLWDEAARPVAPDPDPDAEYSDAGQAAARDLVAVHDHLRTELAQLRDMIAQVADGSLDPAKARSAISKLTMRQNQWTVGAYCESYCRLIGLHHTLEDTSLFASGRSPESTASTSKWTASRLAVSTARRAPSAHPTGSART
jgi:alkanesulfonate monooxygenase SsuD/methylene tetrahydromethanopterin reductase-like flavin-dependent oxidoreductase (luciferase family)